MNPLQMRIPWTAALAALGLGAALLPAQAAPGDPAAAVRLAQVQSNTPDGRYSPAPPDWRSRDMQDARERQGGWTNERDTSGSMSGRMSSEERPLTRQEVQQETALWQKSGLLQKLHSDDSSLMMQPEVVELHREVTAATEAARSGATRDAGGTQDATGMGREGGTDDSMREAPAQQPMDRGLRLDREPTGPTMDLSDEEARRARQPSPESATEPATRPDDAGSSTPMDSPSGTPGSEPQEMPSNPSRPY